jgi:hypothetical protein
MKIRLTTLVTVLLLLTPLSAIAGNSKPSAPILSTELIASNGKSGDQMGTAVAMNQDTIVMGNDCSENGPDPYCDHNRPGGTVYVFQRSATGWSNAQQVAELTPSDGTGYDTFGHAVAIDGQTIVVLAPFGNAAYVYVRPEGGWANMTETAKLTLAGPIAGASSVSVSGNTIVVGVGEMGNGGVPPGAAYVFVRPAQGWTNTAQANAELTASNPTSESYLGYSVSISGNTIVAGAPDIYANAPGAAYVFVEPSTGWANSTETAILSPLDGIVNEYFGFAVSIAKGTVAVGAFQDDSDQGSAYVFVQPAAGWTGMTETAKLTVSGTPSTVYFGWSVATSGNEVVAGAFATNNLQGTAYVFAKPATGWVSTSTPTIQLRNPAGRFFGFSVATNGSAFVIGSPFTTVNSNPLEGAAFVFGN